MCATAVTVCCGFGTANVPAVRRARVSAITCRWRRFSGKCVFIAVWVYASMIEGCFERKIAGLIHERLVVETPSYKRCKSFVSLVSFLSRGRKGESCFYRRYEQVRILLICGGADGMLI